MSAAPKEDVVALAAILANTSQELEALARKASAIDEAVGDMLVAGTNTKAPIPVVLLQDVDLLRQTVDCLHILIGNLAQVQTCPCMVPRDAAGAGIYLASLRDACLRG